MEIHELSKHGAASSDLGRGVRQCVHHWSVGLEGTGLNGVSLKAV